MRLTRSLVIAAAASSVVAAIGIAPSGEPLAAAPSAGKIGPSTTTAPYLVPSPGMEGRVEFTSILTVGDAVGGYKFAGIPDGLGVFRSLGNAMQVLANHEWPSNTGLVRAHGSQGAWVSEWKIDRRSLEVTSGKDMVQSAGDVYLWDVAAKAYKAATTAFQRLCSGDLPDITAFWHGDKGTRDRIYLNGEETNAGRAFAWVATGEHAGEVWQLPRLGIFAWENVVASPYPQDKTVVIPMDDADLSTSPTTTAPSELAVYVGEKQRHGHPVEKAGLTNGKLYGVKVSVGGATVTEESNDFGLGATSYVGKGRFTMVEMGDNGDVSGQDFNTSRAEFIAKDIMRLQRIEDGAWDPRWQHGKGDDFYFVTTADVAKNSRLWRLRFDDIKRPGRHH